MPVEQAIQILSAELSSLRHDKSLDQSLTTAQRRTLPLLLEVVESGLKSAATTAPRLVTEVAAPGAADVRAWTSARWSPRVIRVGLAVLIAVLVLRHSDAFFDRIVVACAAVLLVVLEAESFLRRFGLWLPPWLSALPRAADMLFPTRPQVEVQSVVDPLAFSAQVTDALLWADKVLARLIHDGRSAGLADVA